MVTTAAALTDGSLASIKGFLKTLSPVDQVGADARAAMLATRSIKTASPGVGGGEEEMPPQQEQTAGRLAKNRARGWRCPFASCGGRHLHMGVEGDRFLTSI